MRNGTFPRIDVDPRKAKEELKNRLFLLGFEIFETDLGHTDERVHKCFYSVNLTVYLYPEYLNIIWRDLRAGKITSKYGLEYFEHAYQEILKIMEQINDKG